MRQHVRPPILIALQSAAISINVVGQPWSGGVIASYDTPAATKPATFQNQIYVWETTSNQVPWEKSPVTSTPVPTDSSASSLVVPFDYEQKGYIVGYAVGPEPTAVCSTVYLPQFASGDPARWEYASVWITIVYNDSNLVQVQYGVLAAYRPATHRNWVAIWQGASVPYDGAPLGRTEIQSDAVSSYAVITGLNLTIGSTYAVGYFMVDSTRGRTSLGAQTKFTLSAM